MHKRRSLASLATFLFLVTLSALAFAQGTATNGGPVSVLTPATAVVALLALVAGFVAQAVKTGSILGRSLPATWLPYASLFGSFFADFVASILGATSLTATAWFNAFLAGGFGLLASTAGITAHQHFVATPESKGSARGFSGVGTVAMVALVGAFLAAVAGSLSGCAASPSVVPVTPANLADIASCQGIEQASNLFVIGDFGFTGGAAGLGAVAAAMPDSNGSAKTGLAIGAAASAGVAGVLTGLTAYEHGRFASGQCQQYLGPLPATPFGTKSADAGAE